MTPAELLHLTIDPGLAFMHETLAGGEPSVGDDARILLLTIAGQESGWSARRQVGGPARSYWQFERGGGVTGVMGNSHTGPMLRVICTALDIPQDRSTVFEAMAWNDRLGTAMARFLLFTDPAPLPPVGAQESAWNYYLNLWRPGKPDHTRWGPAYQTSMKALQS